MVRSRPGGRRGDPGSTPQASGPNSLHAGDLLNETNTELFNPNVVPGSFSVTVSPNKPSALASYTLTFQVDDDLVNGLDEIIITWDEDFKNFPSDISTSAVSIRAVGDGGGCGFLGEDLPTCGVTGGNGNEGQAVAPEDVNVDFVTPESADLQPQTKLRIPDMDEDDNSGSNGIRAGATVTVVFRQQAGITNPSKGNGNIHIDLRVTDAGVDGGIDETAVPCTLPDTQDWIVSESCTFQGSATAPGNVIVEPGIALTIDSGASLDINFANFHLLIKSGAKVVIRDGGKIH